MKIFVTGADGFIGSHLVELLVKEGHEVVAFLMKNDDRQNLKDLQVKRIVGDVRDFKQVKAAMKGCDWVFHLAASMNNPAYTYDDFFSVNVTGTKNVMEAALQEGIKKVVHASSNVTIKESTKIVNEEDQHSGNFDGPYAQTKFLGEKVAFEYGAKGLPVVIVLPTVVFGPRMHAMKGFFKMHLQPRIRLASYTRSRLNVIYVKDVAKGMLLAMEKGKQGNRYILGGQELSLGQFLHVLDRAAGINRPILYLPEWVINIGCTIITPLALLARIPFPLLKPQVDAMKRGSSVDCSKAVSELGLRIRPLEDSLHETVEWYRKTGYIR